MTIETARMPELRWSPQPPLGRILLDRPGRRNAMSEAMWRGLIRICAEIELDARIRVVVLEGEGGNFCSGADVAEFDKVFADSEKAKAYLLAIETALRALAGLDRPTIAKLQGAAIGGGLALALACDLRFAGEDVHLAIPPAKLGLVYGPVETQLLVELVGPAQAKDLLFSARAVDADEALRMRLIDRRVSAAELEASVDAYARSLCELSQHSIRGAKRAVLAALEARGDDLRALVEGAAKGEDFREGRAAFREKRKPRFE